MQEANQSLTEYKLQIKEKQDTIQKMKTQYISTLQKMKEDVSMMRKRHQEKLELEISKRKSLEKKLENRYLKKSFLSHFCFEGSQALVD